MADTNKIISNITGGLGNQMFRYAFGRQLALEHKAELKLDISYFENNERNHLDGGFALKHFKIQEIYASKREIAYFKKYKRRRGLLGKLYNPLFADSRRYVNETTSTYSAELAASTPPCYLNGFWLSEKYFLTEKDVIKKDFTLKESLGEYAWNLAEQVSATPEPISLHIRRGFLKDAAANPGVVHSHPVCPIEYYTEAMRIMNEGVPTGSYFIFSDDIAWAKENIHTGRPTTFIGQGPNKNYEDLELMRLCRHHIISNSTFGWWGAWLGEDEGSITIAPAKWVQKPFDTKDLIPERWITLPY